MKQRARRWLSWPPQVMPVELLELGSPLGGKSRHFLQGRVCPVHITWSPETGPFPPVLPVLLALCPHRTRNFLNFLSRGQAISVI